MNVRDAMASGMEPVKQSWSMGMLEHHSLDQGERPQQQRQQQQQHQQQHHHPQQQDVKRARKKLRDSCNSCALSKVKCSRDRPSCERCEDRGIYCRYSPSRRTGKRRIHPSTQSAAEPQSQLPSLDLVTPPEEPCSYDFDFSDYNEMNERAVGTANAQNIPDINDGLAAPTLGDSLMPWDDPLFDVILDDVENDSSDTFDYSSHTMMPPNRVKNIQDPPRPNNGYPATPSKSSDISTFLDFNQPDAHKKMLDPSSFNGLKSLFDILNQGSNTTSKINGNCQSCPRASTSNVSSTGIPRDCMSIALDALQSLHRPHPACTIASEGHSWSQAKTQTLEIDHVLATNKEIIDSIAKTLNCSCSLDTQLALILTVIGFKLIAWYSAVARSDEAQDDGDDAATQPLSSSSSITTTTTTNNTTRHPSKPAAERVAHMPITVGKYNLDGADRYKMHAQMVLSELHRVVRLIEQLGKSFRRVGVGHDRSMDDDCGDEDDDDDVLRGASGQETPTSSVPSIGVVLTTFLRDRVRSATNETMGILKESQQLQYHCF